MRFDLYIDDQYGDFNVPDLLFHVAREVDKGMETGILFDSEGNEAGKWGFSGVGVSRTT